MYYRKYTRGENVTRSGRVSHPTRKVQDYLADSMLKGFLALYTEVLCQTKDIDKMVADKEPGESLQVAVQHWRELREQLFAYFRDLRPHVAPEDYGICSKDMEDLVPHLDKLDELVEPLLPVEDSKETLSTLQTQASALEAEISKLNEEYQRSLSEHSSLRSSSPSPCRTPSPGESGKPDSLRCSRLEKFLKSSGKSGKLGGVSRTAVKLRGPQLKAEPLQADVLLQVVSELSYGGNVRYETRESPETPSRAPRARSYDPEERGGKIDRPMVSCNLHSLLRSPPREIRYKPERESPMIDGLRYQGEPVPSSQNQTSPGRMTNATMMKLLDTFADSRALDSLPKEAPLEPPVFDGNPLMFTTWWNSFQIMIETQVKCDRRRLLYLYQYTKDPVQSIVAGYMNLPDGERAYEKAKLAVISRYGNRMIIADGYKQKLKSWPRVEEGDGRGLAALSDFLWQCHHVMQGSVNLDILHTQEENAKIVRKLPESMQRRWFRKVDGLIFVGGIREFEDTATIQGDFPQFKEFCRFMANEARIATGPCASLAPPQRRERSERRSFFIESDRPPRSRSNEERRPRCSYCREEHHLYKCQQFLNQPVQEKKEYALRRGLCFGCLRRGHRSSECTIRNSALMAPGSAEPERIQHAQETAPAGTTPTDTGQSCNVRNPRNPANPEKGNMYTYVVPVVISHPHDPQKNVRTYAAVDNQSNCSLVTERVREALGMKGDVVNLELTTMGERHEEQCRKLEKLYVRGEGEQKMLSVGGVYTRSVIPIGLDCIPSESTIARYPHLKPVRDKIRQPQTGDKVEMLLGYDCPRALLPLTSLYDDSSNIFAVQTPLGWSVTGTESDNPKARLSHCFTATCRELTRRDLVRAFDGDFAYNEKEEQVKISANDQKFLKIVKEGIRMTDEGKFEVPLPFKEEPKNLPESRPDAVRSLRQVGRKMKKHPSYGQRYKVSMNKLIQSDQSERIPYPDERDPESLRYWSHHGVDHPRKEALRCVFNGSKKIRGVALNDLLLTGPDLTNKLVGVLLRFRLELIAILCDIEGMFHQVRMTPVFRDFVPFVWFEDGDPDKPVLDYRMTVHLFGASSSPGCANYALKETARRFEEKYGTEAADFIRHHFYVDDGLGGTEDVEKAIKLIHDSQAICAEGGFRLCKFDSNSEEVLEAIPEDWRAKRTDEAGTVSIGADPTSRDPVGDKASDTCALGIGVNLRRDALVYTFVPKEVENTRRGYLSGLSSVYDPLGLIGPAILPGRIILQKLCSEQLEWDETVSNEAAATWQEWYQQLKDLDKIIIDRCVKSKLKGEIVKIELHTFVDASTSGYGVCIYLVQRTRTDYQSALVFGKAKVAPLKTVTMPRMELQAAVLGVQAWSLVESELHMKGIESHFYSDSKIMLAYISNLALRCHMYVNNRACFIRSKTRPEQWKYVETQSNPADLASRGVTAEELANSILWWNGPDFLAQQQTDTTETYELGADDHEVKKGQETSRCLLTTKGDPTSESGAKIEEIAQKRGTWQSLLQVITLMVGLFLKGRKISATEVEKRKMAENWIWRDVQRSAFPTEVARLKYTTLETLTGRTSSRETSMKPIPRSSPIYPLNPYTDENGLLRVGGRLNRGNYPEEYKHPVILPATSMAVLLKARWLHQNAGHPGPNWSLGATRASGMWIVKGKSLINKLTRECTVCIRKRRPALTQQMGVLPEERITEAEPFTFAAVDLFGPFTVKYSARSVKKRWVVIYVCLASRGVHMEVADSLDASSFLLSYRRFAGRRGPIRALYSDRGTNFVGGSNEIEAERALIWSDEVQSYVNRDGCDMVEFRFNVPKASHMGGSWERMIRTVRSAMFHTLTIHPEALTDDQFHTIIVETEALVYSRPVSYVDSSGREQPQPISPAQLLTLKTKISPPLPGVFPDTERYACKRWRYVQYLAQQFWERWRREMLPAQQPRQKWRRQRPNLRAGDVVLMMEEDSPRGSWPLARVIQTMPSSDGQVRKVKLRVRNTELERPIQKLILLVENPERTDPQTTDVTSLPDVENNPQAEVREHAQTDEMDVR